MIIFDPKYFEDFRNSVLSHNFKSGEIILLIYFHKDNRYNSDNLIRDFFKETDIKTEKSDFTLSKVKKIDAIESIKFGLKTKVNYTCIDLEFTDSDKNKYSNGFFDFFNNPDCYKLDTRIFKCELDLNDFWEVGGSILVDDEKIGIFKCHLDCSTDFKCSTTNENY